MPTVPTNKLPNVFTTMIVANVDHINESLESIYYLQVQIMFTNTGEQTCKIQRYTLSWSEGTAVIKPNKLIIPPHSSLSRKIRITPDKGDLKSIYHHADSVTVHIDKYHCQ